MGGLLLDKEELSPVYEARHYIRSMIMIWNNFLKYLTAPDSTSPCYVTSDDVREDFVVSALRFPNCPSIPSTRCGAGRSDDFSILLVYLMFIREA